MKLFAPKIAVIAALSLAVVRHADGMAVPALKLFSDEACSSTPTIIAFDLESSCSDYYLNTCSIGDGYSISADCADSYTDFADSVFGESPYLLLRLYEGTSCGTVTSAVAFLIDGKCHAIPEAASAVKGSMSSDGSVTFAMYLDTTCTMLRSEASGTASSDQINTCLDGVKLTIGGATKTTTTTTTTGTSGVSAFSAPSFVQAAAAIAVLAAEVVVLL